MSPLQVLVVGAGIGGLTTAIALRRAGHVVRVLEKSGMKVETGAALTLSPNACRVLSWLGLDLVKSRVVISAGMATVRAEHGSPLKTMHEYQHADAVEKYGAPSVFSHRVDLHEALKSMALNEVGDGVPVELVTKASVASYDPRAGAITLEDGSVLTADLIVAADGVHSKAAQYVLGHECPLRPSKTTVMRWTLSSEEIRNDLNTAPLLAGAQNRLRSYFVSADVNRYILQYPCRDNLLQNFVAYNLADTEHPEVKDLSLRSNRETLLHRMEGFHPAVLSLCQRSHEVLPLWRCLDREPLPSLHLGKLVLVGDAAHPMYPHLGQGAAMSIEDAGVLGVLFGSPSPSINRDGIQRRLELFEQARITRVSLVQLLSRVPAVINAMDGAEEDCRKFLPEVKMPRTREEVYEMLYTFDAVKDASERMSRA